MSVRRSPRTTVCALAAGLLLAMFFAGSTTGGVDATPANAMPTGFCQLKGGGGQLDGRLRYWDVAGVIPAFRRGGPGVVLAPPAEDLPRLGKGPTPPEPFRDQWVLEPKLMASPLDSAAGPCVTRSFDPLGARTLKVHGPYVFAQYDQTASFVVDPGDAPPPQACAGNDPDFPDPSSNIPLPDEEQAWVVDRFCNKTTVTRFALKNPARCAIGDMSRWPRNPYINQYDVGARLGLPLRFGYRGGNASGPSALLMAMLRSAGPRNLPPLTTVYDATMQRPRAAVRPNQPNEFVARKAVAFLRSLGWRSARVRTLGVTVEEIEAQILSSLARSGGQMVVSTAFGNDRWGTTGVGNLIVIVGADPRGRFIVQDPAGNYFASPRGGDFRRGGHYGPGSCGHRVPYPHYWMLAYTTGRYLIELGRRTP